MKHDYVSGSIATKTKIHDYRSRFPQLISFEINLKTTNFKKVTGLVECEGMNIRIH